MQYNYAQPMPITAQPHVPITLVGNPFRQAQSEWSAGLCNCCDDMGQCMLAFFCWPCFLGSLAGKIKESPISCCCVPNALGVYRMKVRSVLKIRGDACDDCIMVTCCQLCVGLQMRNELKNHGLA